MKKKYFLIIISIIIVAAIVVGGQIFTVRHVSVVFYNKNGLATEADVLEAAGLDSHNNIFGLNEKEIRKKVANAFEDNSITVTDIVRSFPDTVTIYVKERIPVYLLKVESEEGDKYVPTDKDFQRGSVHTLDEIDYPLIKVTGFEINETFDIKECILLREIANAFISQGMSEEALPYFLSEINFDDTVVTMTVKESGAKLIIDLESKSSDVAALYNKYIALSIPERNGAVLNQ